MNSKPRKPSGDDRRQPYTPGTSGQRSHSSRYQATPRTEYDMMPYYTVHHEHYTEIRHESYGPPSQSDSIPHQTLRHERRRVTQHARYPNDSLFPDSSLPKSRHENDTRMEQQGHAQGIERKTSANGHRAYELQQHNNKRSRAPASETWKHRSRRKSTNGRRLSMPHTQAALNQDDWRQKIKPEPADNEDSLLPSSRPRTAKDWHPTLVPPKLDFKHSRDPREFNVGSVMLSQHLVPNLDPKAPVDDPGQGWTDTCGPINGKYPHRPDRQQLDSLPVRRRLMNSRRRRSQQVANQEALWSGSRRTLPSSSSSSTTAVLRA